MDLYLTPPVQEFQLLGFDAYEKLYRVGYEYAYKRLAAWDGLQQTVSGSCNNNYLEMGAGKRLPSLLLGNFPCAEPVGGTSIK